jgi:hypothetical protein
VNRALHREVKAYKGKRNRLTLGDIGAGAPQKSQKRIPYVESVIHLVLTYVNRLKTDFFYSSTIYHILIDADNRLLEKFIRK